MSYAKFEAAAREYARACGMFHATALVDIAIEHGLGACASEHVERWLEGEMVADRVAHNHAAPTHSQLALSSLGNSARRDFYKEIDYDTMLAWYYTWREVVPLTERLTLRRKLGLSQ